MAFLRLLAFALLLSNSGGASSATAILQLNGRVTGAHPNLASTFANGTNVTTILAYEFRSPDFHGSDGIDFYDSAVLGGFTLVGSYFIGFTDSARLITADNMPTGDQRPPFDRFLFDNFSPSAAPVNGVDLTVFGFGFEDPTGTALTFSGLPSSKSDLAGFEYRAFSLDFGDYLARDLLRVSGQYDSYSLSVFGAIPEPSTWLMLIVGFGVIGSALRRRSLTLSPAFG